MKHDRMLALEIALLRLKIALSKEAVLLASFLPAEAGRVPLRWLESRVDGVEAAERDIQGRILRLAAQKFCEDPRGREAVFREAPLRGLDPEEVIASLRLYAERGQRRMFDELLYSVFPKRR